MDDELKKILVQLMEGQEALRIGQEALKTGQETLKVGQEEANKRLTKVEIGFGNVDRRLTKVEIGIEDVNNRLKAMAEVQEANYSENQRDHKEIVEMLSERIDTQDKAIKNMKVVK